MTDRELFAEVMKDLGRELGRDFSTDENEWTIPLFGGNVNVCLRYAEESNLVLALVPVTPLAGKPFSMAPRNWLLLEMNAFFRESAGCTLAVDPETGMLTAVDRRAVRYFPSAGAVGNYVRKLGEFARTLKHEVRSLEDRVEMAIESQINAEDEGRAEP